MLKHFLPFLFLVLVSPAIGQEPAKNRVVGLEIPPPQTVLQKEGFVKLTAKCSGPVKWLVTSSSSVKIDPDDDKKTITISLPEPGLVINVFAVSVVDGKLTDFAQTSIQVEGTQVKNDTTNNVKGKQAAFHITFVVDADNVPRDVAAIIGSKEFSKYVSQRQGYFRVYDYRNPSLVQKKLSSLVQKNNNAPTVIIQLDDGQVLNENDLLIPSTEKSVIDLINKYLK